MFCVAITTVSFAQDKTGQDMEGMFDKIKSSIDPSKLANMLMYDSDEVTTKIKAKKTTDKKIVKKSINKYNNGIEVLKAENMSELMSFGEEAMQLIKSKNYLALLGMRSQLNVKIKALQKEVDTLQEGLNDELSNNLKKKKIKKWKKFSNEKEEAFEEAFNITDIISKSGLLGG